jgi:hypothetical protein
VSTRTIAAARRLRFTLLGPNSRKSSIRSQYVDVKTLTGISLCPNKRDNIICMPLWKARGGISEAILISFRTTGATCVVGLVDTEFCETSPVSVTRAAPSRMRRLWNRDKHTMTKRLE